MAEARARAPHHKVATVLTVNAHKILTMTESDFWAGWREFEMEFVENPPAGQESHPLTCSELWQRGQDVSWGTS